MSKKITIAVDGMGGDDAPSIVVEGLAKARKLYPDTLFLLYGDEAVLTPLVAAHKGLMDAVTIGHTDSVVSADEKPSHAVRHGRQSSMGLALQAVKSGEADVAVSAGNTGALMALAKITLRTMPGIERPALVSTVPTLRGETIMLDLGANVECSDKNLVQFAIMGAAYARTVLGLSRPSVALLNVGVEDLKGRAEIRQAAEFLKSAEGLAIDFKGFIEGNAVGGGAVDVVVTDGFTGNVALKTIEGTAKLISALLGQAFRSSFFTKLGYLFAHRGLNALRAHLDPNNHNGGVFMGLNGLVVKSHGGATSAGFCTALSTGLDMIRYDLVRLVQEDLAAIAEEAGEAEEATALEAPLNAADGREA